MNGHSQFSFHSLKRQFATVQQLQDHCTGLTRQQDTDTSDSGQNANQDFGQEEEHAIRLPTSGSFWRRQGKEIRQCASASSTSRRLLTWCSMTNFGLLCLRWATSGPVATESVQ